MNSAQETSFGIRRGDVETSLMLHFAPGSVDMSAARDFRSSAATAVIPPIGPVSYGWAAPDLNPDGTMGEAHLGIAEKGRATCEHQVRGFIEMLRKLRDMDRPTS